MTRSLGMALDVTPQEALLACVRIAAGEVAYATEQIKELSEDEYIGNPQTEREMIGGEDGVRYETTTHLPAAHIWVKMRQEGLDRLARFSKMALDAGVAERMVRVAEGRGAELATLIREVVEEIKITDEQKKRLPDAIRKKLTALEASASSGLEDAFAA